jgi:hypothetical protein
VPSSLTERSPKTKKPASVASGCNQKRAESYQNYLGLSVGIVKIHWFLQERYLRYLDSDSEGYCPQDSKDRHIRKGGGFGGSF